MKKKSLIIIGFIALFLASCANMNIGFEKESVFYKGGIVYIYLEDKSNSDTKYKVYINNENTDIALSNHLKTRFAIQEGQTKIEIVDGKNRTSINLFLSKANNYYLKVIRDENSAITLRQVQKESIGVNVEETPLYIDEDVNQKVKKEEVLQIISDYGDEPISREESSLVDKNTEAPDNGDTIFYYDPQEGE